MAFQKIDVESVSENAVVLIRDRWPLLTVGSKEDFNFMTVNWGMIGELWYRDAMTLYVRHSRHTYDYMSSNSTYTLNVLKKGYEKALSIAGSKSGRDIDKVKETGLSPIEIEGCMAFEEAEYVFVLKRLFQSDLEIEAIEDPSIVQKAYPDGDIHKMYITEILTVYKNVE